ncbi:hypothetical protein BH09BAC1_BH09BAC1_12570 [soil metagenome]
MFYWVSYINSQPVTLNSKQLLIMDLLPKFVFLVANVSTYGPERDCFY